MPPGFCGVETIRPISASPPAVVVTGLSHGAVGLPAANPPVVVSSCFHAILLSAGLNATSRLTDSEFGIDATSSWKTAPPLLITGCWSAAGGALNAMLWMLAQTYSRPVLGLKDGSGHSTPPRNVGENTTYWLSLYGVYGSVGVTYGFPFGATMPFQSCGSCTTCGTSSSPAECGCVGYVCASGSCGTGRSVTGTTGLPVWASRMKTSAVLLMCVTTSICLPPDVIVSTNGVCMLSMSQMS